MTNVRTKLQKSSAEVDPRLTKKFYLLHEAKLAFCECDLSVAFVCDPLDRNLLTTHSDSRPEKNIQPLRSHYHNGHAYRYFSVYGN